MDTIVPARADGIKTGSPDAYALPADSLDLVLFASWLDGAIDAATIAARLHRGDVDVAERLAQRLPVWRRFGVV